MERTMNELALMCCVTLEEAGRMLGGERPYSRMTLYRMIYDGAIVSRGTGRLRRITLQSIQDYVNGATEWQGRGEREEKGVRTRIKTGNGGRKSRSAAEERDGFVVLLPRTPKRRADGL